MILKRRFHYHQKGNHDEKWYYLCFDQEKNDIFIIHEWAERADLDERRIELADFLNTNRSTAKNNLIKLIGSLVTE